MSPEDRVKWEVINKGKVGLGSMSHGKSMDQSVGRWNGGGKSDVASPVKKATALMDGSMGRQLVLDGLEEDALFRQIWAAKALVDPSLHGLVVEAHKRYIEAGSTTYP